MKIKREDFLVIKREGEKREVYRERKNERFSTINPERPAFCFIRNPTPPNLHFKIAIPRVYKMSPSR